MVNSTSNILHCFFGVNIISRLCRFVFTFNRQGGVVTCFNLDADWSSVETLEQKGEDLNLPPRERKDASEYASQTRWGLHDSVGEMALARYVVSLLPPRPPGMSWKYELERTKKEADFKEELAGLASSVYVHYMMHEQSVHSEVRKTNKEDYYRIGCLPQWIEYVRHTLSRYFNRSISVRRWQFASQKSVPDT